MFAKTYRIQNSNLGNKKVEKRHEAQKKRT